MAKIIIGKEYEKAFDSITKLVAGGCVPEEIVRSADGRQIVTDAYVFEYSGTGKGLNLQGGKDLGAGMTSEGATWFSALRGEHYDDGTAVWLNLIEQVAASYHKKYSLLEYKQSAREVSEEEKKKTLGALTLIAEKFYPHLPSVQISEGSAEDGVEDLYGVSLRIELSGGTGATVPVLAKVYFRKRGRSLAPLAEEEARKVDEYLYEIIPAVTGSKKQKTDNSDASETIDAVLDALGNLLYGKIRGADFTSCLYFGNSADEKIVSELTEKVSHDNVKLECTSVSTLGISHVRWMNSSYVVSSEGKPVLRAMSGLNGSLTLFCANCGGGTLIENNRIFYIKKHDDGTEEEISVYIDPTADDLNITDEQAEEILEYGEFSRHLTKMTCSENPRVPNGCGRIVCFAETENLGTEEDPVRKCKDCPYPEVVFRDAYGVRKYTPRLAFARDKMTLIDKAETAVCDCCGRSFSLEKMHGRVCSFCHEAGAARGAAKENAKKRYRRYAQMFSLGTRLRYLKKQKLCFEEEDVLLFVLGSDRYVFNKVDLEEYGYLASPRKVQK